MHRSFSDNLDRKKIERPIFAESRHEGGTMIYEGGCHCGDDDGKSWELHVHELAHFSKDSTSE